MVLFCKGDAPKIWEIVLREIKNAASLDIFEVKIKLWATDTLATDTLAI